VPRLRVSLTSACSAWRVPARTGEFPAWLWPDLPWTAATWTLYSPVSRKGTGVHDAEGATLPLLRRRAPRLVVPSAGAPPLPHLQRHPLPHLRLRPRCIVPPLLPLHNVLQ
jgi:hypothetical protein